MLASLLIATFALLLIFAAVRDAVSFTIPNWTSIAVALLFAAAALAAGLGWGELAMHLAVGLGVLLLGMAMFAFGWLGGGDAKLLAAVSIWMGWPDLLPWVALVAVFGGAFALVLLVARNRLRPVAEGFGLSIPILQRTKDVPYGVAISAASLVYLPKAAIGAALIAAAI
jgi:prepilin peptidase CpaA